MTSSHDKTPHEIPTIPNYETVADLEKFFSQTLIVSTHNLKDETSDFISSLEKDEGFDEDVIHVGAGTPKDLIVWVGSFIVTSTLLISIPVLTVVNIVDLIVRTR